MSALFVKYSTVSRQWVGLIIQASPFYFPVAPQALKVDPPPMIFDEFSPACFNFTHGNYREMEFYSPAYPNQYPNKIDCVMYLQGKKT